MDISSDLVNHPFAIRTLQERCNYLKDQLKQYEEENEKYRISLAAGSVQEVPPNKLLEQIEKLKTQNQQFTNQMNLITMENKNLWNRLNQLAKINHKQIRQLRNVSDTLKSCGTTSVAGCEMNDSIIDRKSVEELSMRLLNSFKMEKSELESQCAEMIDLQNTNDTLVTVTSLDQDPMPFISKHIDKLNKLKRIVVVQQDQLKEAIKRVKFVPHHDEPENLDPERNECVDVQPNINQICPVCRKDIIGDVKTLADHVESHFSDEPFEII